MLSIIFNFNYFLECKCCNYVYNKEIEVGHLVGYVNEAKLVTKVLISKKLSNARTICTYFQNIVAICICTKTVIGLLSNQDIHPSAISYQLSVVVKYWFACACIWIDQPDVRYSNVNQKTNILSWGNKLNWTEPTRSAVSGYFNFTIPIPSIPVLLLVDEN